MGKKLYVGNLSYNTTEEELRTIFQEAGAVVECVVVADKFTGQSRGFGFVEMGSQEDANKAIQLVNGRDLGGRSLHVNEARPREERAPRGDFSRGGGSSGGSGARGGRSFGNSRRYEHER